MNTNRYFISSYDINFLNDIYYTLIDTSLGKCPDFQKKYSNLISKLDKIRIIQANQRKNKTY